MDPKTLLEIVNNAGDTVNASPIARDSCGAGVIVDKLHAVLKALNVYVTIPVLHTQEGKSFIYLMTELTDGADIYVTVERIRRLTLIRNSVVISVHDVKNLKEPELFG